MSEITIKKGNIVSNFKIFAGVLAVILLAALIMGIIVGGFNLGIDFTGGTLVSIEMGGEFDDKDVKAVIEKLNISVDYTIAKTGELGSATQAAVRFQSMPTVEEEDDFITAMVDGIKETYPAAEAISTDRVGATAGKTLVQNAFFSVLLASALMLIYIWIRFELVSGIIAVITSVLNVLVMCAFMVFFRSFMQINSSFIAACLTIVGYSINNTIIVLDRIREDNRRLGRRSFTRKEVAEHALRSCMGRMINTTITSLITITVLYILGVDSIRQFALPLIIGIAAGTYISIFIVPAMWGIWMDKAPSPKKA